MGLVGVWEPSSLDGLGALRPIPRYPKGESGNNKMGRFKWKPKSGFRRSNNIKGDLAINILFGNPNTYFLNKHRWDFKSLLAQLANFLFKRELKLI